MFRHVRPCRLQNIRRRFEGSHCFYIHSQAVLLLDREDEGIMIFRKVETFFTDKYDVTSQKALFSAYITLESQTYKQTSMRLYIMNWNSKNYRLYLRKRGRNYEKQLFVLCT